MWWPPASRAMDALLYAGCLRADLPPSKPCLITPTAHVGGRGVYKLYGAHRKRQRGACIRCILYTAVVMYTSTSPPLPVLSDVYVYVLYTYTKICHHACAMYAFYTAKIHQKQGIFLMYATENDVYIKLLYARVYVARQHRGSCRGSYRG